MEIHYHWHNVEHSEALQKYAEKKIKKLMDHFHQNFRAVVVRFKSEKKEKFCEFSLDNEQGQFVASTYHPEFYAAIDLVEAKLEKQIRRHKEKILSKRQAHQAH